MNSKMGLLAVIEIKIEKMIIVCYIIINLSTQYNFYLSFCITEN